jgi:HPt (histidine-containing phosphotransfer) domain-containing protein
VKTFYETYADVAKDVRALFDAQDLAGLAAKAHTLAGASGNISAKDVLACAEKIEKDARAGHVDVADIDAFEEALKIACLSMERLLGL